MRRAVLRALLLLAVLALGRDAVGQPVPTVQPIAPDSYTASISDANTLIDARVEHASYAVLPDLDAFSVLEMHATSAAYGPMRRSWFNYDQRARTGGWRGRPFVVPTTCTGARLRLREVQQQSSVGATGAARIEVWDWAGLNQISTTACTVGATSADCLTSDVMLTAGRGYQARVVANTGGVQSSFLASTFHVEPRGCSDGFFTKPFVRIEAQPVLHGVTSLPGVWRVAHHGDQDPLVRARIRTTAAQIVVGTWENEADYIGSTRSTFGVITDGRGQQAVQPMVSKGLAYTSVTVPGAGVGAPVGVEIGAGMQVMPGYATSQRRGVALTEFLFPASAFVAAERPSSPVVWATGDSKTASSYSAQPSLDALHGLLVRRGWAPVFHAAGGNTAAADLSLPDLFGLTAPGCPAATAACAAPLAQRAAAHRPKMVVLAAGRNDKVGGVADVTIAAEVGATADAIHAAVPSAIVSILGFSKESNAFEPGMDSTRGALYALVASRSTWARYVGPEGLWTTAQAAVIGHATDPTSDTTHPSGVGYQLKARLIAGEPYPVPPIFGSALVWLDGSYGAIGGGAGTGVAGGGGPAVTVTGSPSAEVPGLVVEMQSASTYRLSLDGGETWAESGVSFNAGAGDTKTIPSTGAITTGWSLNFAAGTYSTLHTYQWLAPQVGQWLDRSGAGHDFTRTSTNYGMLVPRGINGRPAVQSPAGGHGLHPAVPLAISPPYTIAMVAQLGSYTILEPWMTTAAGGYPLIYSTGAAAMACNTGGGHQLAVSGSVPTPTPTTQPVVLLCTVDGASSSFSVGNPEVATNVTSGTLDAVNLVDPTLGGVFNLVNGSATYGAFAVFGATTSDERLAIYFALRDRYGAQ